ncbi:unnamed protein product [Citrullus colocynthis]|uniref:Uncharacterized protein n=1 Tax=Citrullus colocynthis TaxID=252529 RepID=A0ABP0Z6R1_9ROSI
MADEGATNCIDILLAILLPPLGVFLKFGCQGYGRFGKGTISKDDGRNWNS